jgi:hypothetical protein
MPAPSEAEGSGRLRLLLGPRTLDPAKVASMAFRYDATADGNLALSGPSITSFLDLTGNGRTASQGTGAFQAIRTAAAINGRNAGTFDGNDTYAVANATLAYGNVPAIGCYGVLLKSSFPDTEVVFRIESGTLNVALFVLQILGSRKLRLTTRRLGSDDAKSQDSARPLNAAAAIQSFFAAQCRYDIGEIHFRIDDFEETYPVQTIGVPGWQSTLGNTEDAEALSAPSFSGASASWGVFGSWTGVKTAAQIEQMRIEEYLRFATPLHKLRWTAASPIARNRSRKEIAGVRDGIPVAGSVSYGPDADVSVRLVSALDVIDNVASPAEGVPLTGIGAAVDRAWSSNVDGLPIGHWYRAARIQGDNVWDEVIDTANLVSVTKVYFAIGQSPERKIWGMDGRWATQAGGIGNDVGVTVPLPGAGTTLFGRRFSRDGYFDPTAIRDGSSNAGRTGEQPEASFVNGGPGGQDWGGNGLAVFLALYYARRGHAPLVVARAVGGSPVLDWVKAGTYPWGTVASDGPNWTAMADAVTQAGAPQWEMSGAFWSGGEAEANDPALAGAGTTNAAVKNHLRQVIAQLRAEAGNPTLPVWISILVRTTAAFSDDSADDVIDAQLEMIDTDADVHLSHNPRDLDIEAGDTQHIKRQDYANFTVPRREQNVARVETPMTESHGATGPKVTSATFTVGTRKVLLNVAHDGGTTLKGSPGSRLTTDRLTLGDAAAAGLSQFGPSIWLDGVAHPLTAAYLETGKVALEYSAVAPAITSGMVFGFKHQRGRAPSNTMVVHDDSALAVPLQPSRGPRGLQTYTVP